MDVEVAPAGQRAVDDGVLEDDAAGPAGGERLVRDVEAGDAGAPAVGATVVVSMPMVVDLPAPFGPEQSEHLAGRDLEVDAPDGLDAARVGLASSRARRSRDGRARVASCRASGRHIEPQRVRQTR